jgi:hypothetical protein
LFLAFKVLLPHTFVANHSFTAVGRFLIALLVASSLVATMAVASDISGDISALRLIL